MLLRVSCVAILAFLLLFIPNIQALGKEKSVHTSITSVIIYSDRGMIVREGKSQISSGTSILMIPDLSPQLIDQSVRVKGSADIPVSILDVKVVQSFLDTIPEERIRILQNKLRDLRTEEQKLLDNLSVLKSQKDFVDTLRNSIARESRPATAGRSGNIQEWEKLLAFNERKLQSLYAEIRGTNSELTEIRNKVEAVEREIRDSQAYSRKMQKNVLVTVQADKPTMLNIEVSYLVVGARWTPTYEARVRSGSSSLQLVYSALVRQNTGEEWKDVELTLSTARPSVGGKAPSLFPWYIDIFQPPPISPMVRKSQELRPAQDLAMEGKIRSEIQAYEMVTPIADVEQQVTSVSFKVPVKGNVPSDNADHKVSLRMIELTTEMKYLAVPKLSSHAYLTVKTKNHTDYPFLRGAMNVFFDNAYVSSSSIETIMPGDEFELGIGADERIRIERKLVNRFTEYTGTFTKKTKVQYEYLIKIENTKIEAIDLDLSDQIPVSKNEKIVVEISSPSLRDRKPDADGILRWQLRLSAGEKRDLKLHYSVEYPSDLRVIGLE